MKNLYKVKAVGEMLDVRSEKAEGGVRHKRRMVLRELDGKYADEFAVTLLGKDAICQFYAGDVVYASLQFRTNEVNGAVYQDITVKEIYSMKN